VDVLAATDLEMEAQWVAHRILELLDASPEFGFKDVAVLVRNTEVMAAFTAAFDKAGVAYLVNRGKGFYETREVNDLTCLLRVIANPRDEIGCCGSKSWGIISARR
jgi:superfamily I DNA/RNA helicase